MKKKITLKKRTLTEVEPDKLAEVPGADTCGATCGDNNTCANTCSYTCGDTCLYNLTCETDCPVSACC